MRLWSVVVSQPATRPCVQGTRVGAGSTLTATRLSLGDRAGDVGEERVLLQRAPALADGGHELAAVFEQRREALLVGQERASLQGRADPSLALHAVARGADALERLLAEARCSFSLGAGLALEPTVERGSGQRLHVGSHLGMLDAAKLRAPPLVRPRL